MGRKYLGEHFDIQGGGMDLVFPHHECEIAQANAAMGHDVVKYWMHNNMITIEGKKMGKSLGNFITLEQFFNGDHPKLQKAYSPMTIRFFILSAHYRGTVDFSNEALQAAEKGLDRLQEAYRLFGKLIPADNSTFEVAPLEQEMQAAMDDDLNSPQVLATLFEMARLANRLHDGSDKLTTADLEHFKLLFHTYACDILGLNLESSIAEGDSAQTAALHGAVDMLLEIRQEAKAAKDWTRSDMIRDRLAALGFTIKDSKNGADWSL